MGDLGGVAAVMISSATSDRHPNQRGAARLEGGGFMSTSRSGAVLAIALCVVVGFSPAQDSRPDDSRHQYSITVRVLGPDGAPLCCRLVSLFFVSADASRTVWIGGAAQYFGRRCSVSEPGLRQAQNRIVESTAHVWDATFAYSWTDRFGLAEADTYFRPPVAAGLRLGAAALIDGRRHMGLAATPAPSDTWRWNAGDLTLAPREPVLSGVLVDDRGRSVPKEEVDYMFVDRFPPDGSYLETFDVSFIGGDAVGRFEVDAGWISPEPGAPLKISLRRKGTNAYRSVRAVVGPERNRIVVPRRALPLTGRIDLAGLKPKELFLFVEAVGRFDHCAEPLPYGVLPDRIFGTIHEDGTFVVEQAPTGTVSMVVGGGSWNKSAPFVAVPDGATLLRIDGLRLTADERCDDPRLTALDLRGRFVAARVSVRYGHDRPAFGVVARVDGSSGVEVDSKRETVLRLVASRFPIVAEFSDGRSVGWRWASRFHDPYPRFGSAVVSITGDTDVRLPSVALLRHGSYAKVLKAIKAVWRLPWSRM